jgi:hypothetical protein
MLSLSKHLTSSLYRLAKISPQGGFLIVSTNLLSVYLFHISTSETVSLCKGKEKLQWAPLF